MTLIKGQNLKYWLKNWRNSISSLLVNLLIIACLSLSLFIPAVAEKKPVVERERFPELIFRGILTNEFKKYLGLSIRKNRVSIKDIPGSVFIFEIFSTYCTSCPRNVPILNEIYSIIENNPDLRGKIKIIGIAVGNNKKEVETFMKEHNVLYPIFTDYNFEAHRVLGYPRVPYTIFVKRNAKGENVIVCKTEGILGSSKEVMDKINSINK